MVMLVSEVVDSMPQCLEVDAPSKSSATTHLRKKLFKATDLSTGIRPCGSHRFCNLERQLGTLQAQTQGRRAGENKSAQQRKARSLCSGT